MLALAFNLLLQAATADLSKGSHLYGSCQAAVRLMDEPNSQQAKTELPSSTYCFGYLGGYIDGVNRLGKQICLNGASLNAVVRVYVDYMRKNPKLMDAEREVGVLLAALNAYPCTK